MGNFIAAALVLILLAFFSGFYFYPQMPESMASHWNFAGNADGYMSKSITLFLMPVISLFMVLLFFVIPKIDPLRSNIAKFRTFYEGFVLLMIAFLLYVHTLVLAWGLGYRFAMGQMLSPAFGVLFYYIGILVGHAKRNYFIGIRTPWTLASEKVWDETHKIGSGLFKAAGVLAVLGAFLPEYGIFLVIVPALISVIYAYAFSYLKYSELPKSKKK